MKKHIAILVVLLSFISAFQAKAEDEIAVITHIEALQWKLTWEDYRGVNPMNVILDNPEYMAYLTDDEGNKTWLYYKKEVVFPEYGNYFTINLESLDLAEGEYELTIPAAYIQFVPGNAPNVEQFFDIIVGEEPESDFPVVISGLNDNTFDIYWENVTALSPGDTTGAFIVNVQTQEKYDMAFLQGENYSSANIRISSAFLKVNITNNYPDLPDGKYEFYLPAGYVTFNGTGRGNEAIEGYELNYVAPWSEGPVAVDGPDEDGLITMTWENASEARYNPDYKGDGFGTTGISVYDGKDIQVAIPYPTNITSEGNVVTIHLNGLGLASGQCQMVVPEDCIIITVEGEEGLTNGFVYRFDYVNPDEEEDPEPGVPIIPEYPGEAEWSVEEGGKLSEENAIIEVSWQGHLLTPVENPEDQVSIFGETMGYKELAFGTEVNISEDNSALIIDLSGLAPDHYRINMPAGYVYFDADGGTFINGYSALENVVILSGAGVDGLSSEQGIFKVFSLKGEKIMETEKEEDIRTLPKGIYIINGRKVVK